MKRFRFHGRKARARSVVAFSQPESLEKRELLSFSAHVNFQTSTAFTPSGYVADTGKTYASRNGLTYGWNADNSANTRNKDSSISQDQRYDTFAHMQRSGNYTWQIAVPNGTYNVHIVGGDAGFYDSAFRINAEGKLTVNGNPTSSHRWVEGTQSVTVSDGKLTISSASGANNNKLDYIDIAQTSTSTSSTSSSTTTIKSAPAAPSNLSASSASSTSIKVAWSDNSVREDGYKIERSTDGKTFSQIATVGASTTSYTNTGLSSGKKYYYRVRGYNTYGNSSYTNSASATTGSSSSTSGNTDPTNHTPPAAPSNLSASSASSSSIKLKWNDNSVREDGYKIERSTDGKTWSQITSVSANTTSYTNSGLSNGKKYYYRVRAYNAYGNSAYASSASATTGSSSTSTGGTSAPSENPTSGYFDGVFVGGDDPNKIIPVLRDLGAKSVRLWGSFSDWGSRSETQTMKNAIAYHNAGFKVDLLLQNPNSVPSYSQAKSYYAWALTVPGLKSAVDFWEIQNEPNLSQYWKGSLSQYVNNVLKAAWDTIHAAGEKVMGAGVTASRSANQSLKDAGYLKYVDYANVHPYDSGASGQRQTITDIKAMFSSKPLVITEWGLQTSGSTSWADMLNTNHPFVAANTSAAWYFPLIQTSSPAGGEGLLTSSLAKHEPFYDMFKSWHA
jgi:hypothetical protein